MSFIYDYIHVCGFHICGSDKMKLGNIRGKLSLQLERSGADSFLVLYSLNNTAWLHYSKHRRDCLKIWESVQIIHLYVVYQVTGYNICGFCIFRGPQTNLSQILRDSGPHAKNVGQSLPKKMCTFLSLQWLTRMWINAPYICRHSLNGNNVWFKGVWQYFFEHTHKIRIFAWHFLHVQYIII